MAAAQGDAASPGFPPPRRAWAAVGVLCLVTACAFVDRQLIYLFVEPLRRTLHLTDTQLSLIQGLAFVVFYTFMGVPLGRLVDRHNRRNLIILGVLVWSVMTMLGGFAQDFWTLFAARAGVGVGEAILGPAAYSLLADYFEPGKRGRAIAIVALSATVGSGGSFLIGGLVLQVIPGDALVHAPLVGDRFGWQLAFMVAGAPGLLIALTMLAIREPARQEKARPVEGGAAAALRPYVRRYGRLLLGAFATNSLLMLNAYGVAAWMATYFIRRFEMPPSKVGYAVGIVSIVAAVVGGSAGGAISDWLGQRRVGGRFDIYIICTLLGLPLLASWTFAPDPLLAMVLLTGVLGTLNLAACTTPTILQEVAPNELRGLVLGSYNVVQGVVAAGLGPISIALVTDQVLRDPSAVGLSIPLVTVPMVLIVVVLALALRRPYARTRAEIIRATSGAPSPQPAAAPASTTPFDSGLTAEAR